METTDFKTMYRQTFAQVHCPAAAAQAAAAPRPRRRPLRRLAVCLAAPLLLAAGVLASGADFTNLRDAPRPSFAPDATTGYAVSLPYRTFPADTLGQALQDDLQAVAEDRWEVREDDYADTLGIGGYTLLFDHGYSMDRYDNGNGSSCYGNARPFDQWQDVTDYTGLPLLRNTLLEDLRPGFDVVRILYRRDEDGIPLLDSRGMRVVESTERPPCMVELVEEEDSGLTQININWSCRTEDDFQIELQAQAFAAPAGEDPVEGLRHYLTEQRFSGLTWEAEQYTLPTGDVAVLPVCTSNPERYANGGLAYFVHDGILYGLKVYDYDDTSAERADLLRQTLDSFSLP